MLSEFLLLDQQAIITKAFQVVFSPSSTSIEEVAVLDKEIAKLSWWLRITNAYPAFADTAQQYVNDIEQANVLAQTNSQLAEQKVIAAVGNITRLLDDEWLMFVKGVAVATVLNYLTVIIPNILVRLYVSKQFYFPNDLGAEKLMTKLRADHVALDAKQTIDILAAPD